MEKIKLFVFALLAMFVAVVGVSAEATDIYNDGVLTLIKADTIESGNPSVVNSGNSYTITFDNTTFKLVAGDPDQNKADNSTWAGTRITIPDGYTKYSVVRNGVVVKQPTDLTSANYTIYYEMYIGFDEEELEVATKSATNIVKTFEVIFSKDNSDDTVSYVLKYVFVPSGITLKAKENDEIAWDNEEYHEVVAEVMNDVYDDLDATVSVAKGYDVSKYTEESVKALEEAIAEAEYALANKNLTSNNQAAIRTLRSAITTAIVNLVQKGDEPVKPGSNNPSNTDEKAPNTFDAGLVYMGLALSAIGTSVVSIKKLRNN